MKITRKWKRLWKRTQKSAVTLGLGLVLSATSLGLVYAGPEGGVVVGGEGNIIVDGKNTKIEQKSGRMAIDWQNFNIAADEMVQFMQPGVSSIALNRILGSDASAIYGKLSANGQVFLSNPNGILFAPGASVNVDGLVATTMDIDPDKFMSGGKIEMTRYGDGTSVVNKGDINTKSYAVFVADTVQNEGLIAVNGSRGGKAVFGNGENVTIDVAGDGLVSLSIDKTTVDSLIENKGIVRMTGAGDVLMTASGADEMVNNVINNEGIIEANSLGHITLNGANTIVNKGTGTISAKGGAVEISAAGTVEQRGIVTTASDKGAGGEIKISAVNKVELGGTVDASGKSGGGKIYIGGGSGGKGTAVNAKETIVAQDAQIKADATSKGNGGNIVIWSDENTEYYGNISAKGGSLGGDGGTAEVSGKLGVHFAGMANLSAKGKIGNITINAATVEVGANGSDTISGEVLSKLLTNANVNLTNANFRINYYKGKKDIKISDSLNYSGKNSLSVVLLSDIVFDDNSEWNIGGSAKVLLEADNYKSGLGEVKFGKSGQFRLSEEATADIYTHPNGYHNAIDYLGNGMIVGDSKHVNVYYNVDGLGDLQSINNNLKLRYVLTKDIDSQGIIFRPLGGNGLDAFTGEFDGRGYIIKNLLVTGYDYAGLFGKIGDTASVKNVGLVDLTIKGSGNGNIGGLVGQMDGGKIENVYAVGLVDARGAFANAGGLVGYMVDGKISKSYSTADVYASSGIAQTSIGVKGEDGFNAGGFVGVMEKGSIITSYSLGKAMGGNGGEGGPGTNASGAGGNGGTAGAFVGILKDGSISGCYSKGDSFGGNGAKGGFSSYGGGRGGNAGNAGGFVGIMEKGIISESYSLGKATGGNGEEGGPGNASGAGGNAGVAGGFVGILKGGLISGSYSKGEGVGGNGGAAGEAGYYGGKGGTGGAGGGFVGIISGGNIKESFATGNGIGGTGGIGGDTNGYNTLTGDGGNGGDGGGFAGNIIGGNINDTYSTGNGIAGIGGAAGAVIRGGTGVVGNKGKNGFGGGFVANIIGKLLAGEGVERSYTVGKGIGDLGKVGAFAGNGVDISQNCIYNKDIQNNYLGAGQGRSTAEMLDPFTYIILGWDTNIWKFEEGKYPWLQWQK